jgi:ATP-dependent RNA helicase DDX18/HAS1
LLRIDEIIGNLPESHQAALFSAIQTQNVNSLADDSSTASGLTQSDVITPADQRLKLLITFLRKNKGKKIMIFFSTKISAKFRHKLLKQLKIKTLDIHGDQSQQKRTEALNQY